MKGVLDWKRIYILLIIEDTTGMSHLKMDTSAQGLSHLFRVLGTVVNGVTGTKLALLKCHGISISS